MPYYAYMAIRGENRIAIWTMAPATGRLSFQEDVRLSGVHLGIGSLEIGMVLERCFDCLVQGQLLFGIGGHRYGRDQENNECGSDQIELHISILRFMIL